VVVAAGALAYNGASGEKAGNNTSGNGSGNNNAVAVVVARSSLPEPLRFL